MREHRHHIIPRHMGGTNEKHNVTCPITIEDHAIAHWVLFRRFGCWQDKVAWKVLSGQWNMDESREYARRKAIGDHFRGRVRPQHEKDKIRESMMGKNKGKKYGPRTFTEEHKANISKATVGRDPQGCYKAGWKHTPEAIAKIKVANAKRKGVPRSPEVKAKIAEAQRRRWAERRKNETL